MRGAAGRAAAGSKLSAQQRRKREKRDTHFTAVQSAPSVKWPLPHAICVQVCGAHSARAPVAMAGGCMASGHMAAARILILILTLIWRGTRGYYRRVRGVRVRVGP